MSILGEIFDALKQAMDEANGQGPAPERPAALPRPRAAPEARNQAVANAPAPTHHHIPRTAAATVPVHRIIPRIPGAQGLRDRLADPVRVREAIAMAVILGPPVSRPRDGRRAI